MIFAFALAIGFALMLFKVTPALMTSWLPIETTALSWSSRESSASASSSSTSS